MQRNARLSFSVPVGQLQHQIGNALGSVGSAGGAHVLRHLRKLRGVRKQVADEVIQIIRRERALEQHLGPAPACSSTRAFRSWWLS